LPAVRWFGGDMDVLTKPQRRKPEGLHQKGVRKTRRGGRRSRRTRRLRAQKTVWRTKNEIVLDIANKKRNTRVVSRWAMSPVSSSLPSPTAPGFRVRRRARPSSALLFPICPERSPNQREEELAPLFGPGSSALDTGTDCPPAPPTCGGAPVRSASDFQKAAASAVPDAAEGSAAPLVGIARLASISPVAPTRRKSPERPEYYFLPVR
jgi:hypothetical protein